MYLELKENKPHGTKEYPYTQYFIRRMYKTSKTAFHIPVHWHEELEIVYVKAGKLTICIGEELFHAGIGDVFFVNSGELHFMESDDMSVEYYTLLFPLKFISFQTEDLLEQEVLQPLRMKQLLFPTTITNERVKEQIVEVLKKVVLTYEEKEKGYQLRTRIFLLEIMELLIEEKSFYKSFGKTSSMQRDMLSFIQAHYTEKITLEMLAEEFHLSQKYISYYFKEHFSISFMQYVGHLRMTKAKSLLEHTDLSITEVALSSGFFSVNLFIRNFKEMYQMTPLQYRKKSV
ncbi:MAG: helix-turn-helix transcriptional regulator [Lachnospiraceae bacterium]|nr:helix-turn-helix transcriptional regulator [Lachnospiraceae bacterium]